MDHSRLPLTTHFFALACSPSLPINEEQTKYELELMEHPNKFEQKCMRQRKVKESFVAVIISRVG